ncbi:MAG: ATP-dependent helicase, partial [Nitrospinota bacterium]
MPTDIYTTINRLNPMQKEAVCQTDGPVLILAGAGSGKTRVITLRTAFLLEQGVPQSSILAVTFTNKAAKEMKDRVRKITGEKKSSSSLVISTFHSLCLTILRQNIEHLGYKNNFTIYDTSDQLTLIRNVMSDFKHVGKSYKAEEIQEEISRIKNGMPLLEKNAEEGTSVYIRGVYEKYQRTLKILNAVDFDDLLDLTVTLFKEHPGVLEKYQARFSYIMVDEYQDTNRVQYTLIKQLSAMKKNLCVVGDDDQSIYGWRGADLRNIIDFEKDFPDAKIIRLEQNYRSYGNILEAANGVIKENKNRMP